MTSLHLDQRVDPWEPDEFFGVPEKLPRVGDEFQVEIPPLKGESNHVSQLLEPKESENRAQSLPNLFIGLPIPLTWINLEKRGILSEDVIKPETNLNNEKFEIVINLSSDLGKPTRELQNNRGSLLVPGLSDEHWSDAEKASFLLGLYIFQRNFDEVRKFVETKEMGAILAFYYGEFYGSDEYRRWSDGLKKKSKKLAYGENIFSGLRQQELLSRVLPTLSEDHRDALLEVSKRFGDEKISLSEYVSSLKAMVGMDTFVKAIGIGKGKQDLTRMALHSSSSKKVNPTRLEIPIGKACSTLTTSEIIKFLSGDYRLSKARSNDLFWEAVWPLLLARGWHSEQPKGRVFSLGLNNSLVFLVPGVKKFSSKLVKGDHYFDSITDILRKVAKDPKLIELDTEGVESEKKKEQCLLIGGKNLEQDEDESPSRQKHRYLQPHTPSCDFDIIGITIVDTSLLGRKVIKLRGLSTETFNTLTSQDDSYGSKYQSLNHAKGDISVGNLKRKKDLRKNTQPRKVSNSHLSQKLKTSSVNNTAPIGKQCRQLTLSTRENGVSNCFSSMHESTEKLSPQTRPHADKLSSTSSSKQSPSENVESASYAGIHDSESSLRTETQSLIDLNMPPVSPEAEDGVFTSKEQNNGTLELNNQCLPNISANEARSEQQSFANDRRHSKRSRPPTTKALEALANGYFTLNRKRKSKDNSSEREAVASRPSQRARVAGPTESTSSSVASQVQEVENGVSSSGTCNFLSDFRALPDANATEETFSGK